VSVSEEVSEASHSILQAWVRSENCTRCRRGRGRGPTRSMAAPALRYCPILANERVATGYEKVREEILESIHQIAERIGVRRQANDALLQ
jgi:trimethylamine:corrinoid methyltransferase-like protein